MKKKTEKTAVFLAHNLQTNASREPEAGSLPDKGKFSD